MTDATDSKRKKQSALLCKLLDLHIECYGSDGVVFLNRNSNHLDHSIKLPFWLVERIIKLRPALEELDDKNRYENYLIHNLPVDNNAYK